MDSDPPRLMEEPRMATVIRAMREEEPSSATDARVLSMLATMEASVPQVAVRARFWIVGGIAIALLSLAAISMVWTRAASRVVTRPNEPSIPAPVEPAPVNAMLAPERALADEERVELPNTPPESEAPTRTTASARARPPTPDIVPSEEELILQARQAIPRDLPRASSILTRHGRLYPRGVMTEERDALRIEILVARGEREHAAIQFESWRRRYPGSAHTPRLERMLEAD